MKLTGALFQGISLISGLALVGVALAGGGHSGGHDDDHAAQHASGGAMHHQHDEWVDPPAAYADLISHKWADIDAIANGKIIYQQQCMSCHGTDGQGTGPISSSLRHPPADLTNNFHTEPGNGDGYLFWRVSEGGLVEPFRSQGSAMPAFKDVLSKEQRWDVLAYVHTFFHQGLMKWSNGGSSTDEKSRESETAAGG